MKKINLTTFVLTICIVIALTESCKKEESCPTINCNTGTFNEGTCDCDCPVGFSGTNCETEDLCVTQNVDCQNGGTCVEGICDCPDGYTGTICESFDPAQVQTLLNEGKTPKELFNGNIPLDSLYGKQYEGGLIFYLNIDNGSGMVAAIGNQSVGAEWGCFNDDIDGATGEAIGTGAQNTTDIVNGCIEVRIAAKICDELILNGKADWFLPSIDELILMHDNLHMNGHGEFTGYGAFYWSSTEYDFGLSALGHFFYSGGNDGYPSFDNKFEDNYVRAARAF